MKKTITIYELLGLVKDKKAPKKVLIHDKVYYLLEDEQNYVYSKNSHDIRDWEMYIDNSINITRCLNDEVLILEDNEETEIQDEEEFEDIEPLILRTFERTGQAVTTDRLEDYCDYNFEKLEEEINQLIKNQKKIIERLNKEN
ncbi:MAG: hypothetical protein ACI31S_01940 [Bacilli bacterium]